MVGRPGETTVAYRGLWDGLTSTVRTEGIRGLYKGVGLAVFGVSNGAIQFMSYEQLKQWRKVAALQRDGKSTRLSEADMDQVQLSNTEYTTISAAAKLIAISLTYPYQVVRSRVQNLATAQRYPTTWSCIAQTYKEEGLRAFYRGFATNAVRILPGTCVTFVAYENVAWALQKASARRDAP